MSYGHRRRSALEQIAYGRPYPLFRRSSARSDREIFTKDLQPLELDSGTPELRLTPFTFFLVDTDAFRNGTNYSFILADTTDDGAHVESEFPSNMVGHDASSPRLFMINLNTNCPRSSSSDIRGEASSSVQGKKNLSSTSGNSSIPNTNIDNSDFLVDLFPKAENKAKRKSRKKGKKKGKQHKRVSSRKDSNEADAQCNAKINSTSVFKTSTPGSLCSSDKHLSDNNSSDEVASVNLLDKDDSTNTNEFLDCQKSFLSTSFSDDIDDFKTVVSSERFSGDELPSDTINSQHSSGSINNAGAVSFVFDESSRGEDFKENNSHDDNSLSIPKDKTSQQWDSDISENAIDDTVMQLPVKDETGLSSSEISKDCHSNFAYLSNAALDACSGTERADCIKQDDLSNGFHLVVSGRRRRRARKRMGNGALNGANTSVNANTHNNAAKDDEFSTCPTVEKFGEECSKPNSMQVTPPQSELSSKDNKMESQNNKPVVLKKSLSGITSGSEANSKQAGVTLPKSTVGNSVDGVKCKPNSIAKNAKHKEGDAIYTAKIGVPNGAKDHIQQREGFQNLLHEQFNSQTKTEAKLPGDTLSERGISKLTDHCLPEPEKKIPVLMEEGICPSEVSCIPITSKIESISTKMNSESTLGSIVRTEGQQFRKPFFGSYRELCNLNRISSPIQKSIPFGKGGSTDIDKIMLAIIDASHQRRVVEYAQFMIGCPIADFERLLFMASPIIRQTGSHNICLKNIWKWYEEPGCFGLEVKAHEFRKSRSLPNGKLEFSAYFVPSLSAVQLFGMPGTSRNCDRNPQVDKTSADVCLLKFSSEEEDLSDQKTNINQPDLFFEYFESELPPRRQPLFNKIKELTAGGDTLSGGCMFGNPSALESTKLQHLHPASWYCVAWYPIYRIPIGSLRAAFLTYHSLGHFSSPSNPAYAPGSFDALVSPVVGLQTYNDKRENWFQPTDKGANVLHPGMSSSELVKERLRTLRQTAAAMSCAVVSKGDCRSANRHPDYKFFMSRSW